MTRDDMIEILTEVQIDEFVRTPVTAKENNLVYVLQEAGWRPFDSYSDKELKEAISHFNKKQINNYIERINQRLENKEVFP